MERNGAWERERVGAGDGGGTKRSWYLRTYVRIHVRTYLRAYVRVCVRMYIRTYTFVAGCSNAYVCTDMLRTYVRQLKGGKVTYVRNSGKVLFGTALDEHCARRLVLLHPVALSAGGAQLTLRLRRK